MRKLRFEVTPQFVTSINQDYKHAFGPGINLQFHLTDWLAIGVQGVYTLNTDTALEDKVRGAAADARRVQLVLGTAADPADPRRARARDQRDLLGVRADHAVLRQDRLLLGAVRELRPVRQRRHRLRQLHVRTAARTVGHDRQAELERRAVAIRTRRTATSTGSRSAARSASARTSTSTSGSACSSSCATTSSAPTRAASTSTATASSTQADEGPQNNLFFGVGVTFMLPPSARQTR